MRFRLLQQPALSVPPGVEPQRYYLGLLGPLALGLSAGIQVTITAFLALGPAADAGLATQLTEFGRTVTRPEHDLGIYVAGAAFTLFMVWLTVWYWRGKVDIIEASKAPGFMTAAALMEGVLAAVSMIVYVLLLCSGWFSSDFQGLPAARPPTAEFDAIRLLLPCLLALVCAAVDLESGLGQSPRSASRLEQSYLRLGKVLRYAVPVFIILVVGVPPQRWCFLAGQFFGTDLCHHLSFFVMGPALSFSHGKAFGTEIYSQYGIGWPLLASALARFSALTYGNLVGMEIVYGCIYYVTLFFLLRTCFKHEVWAAFGVILAIYWQIFSGVRAGEVIWQYPSSTIMRHPLDVWFFLALVMHQRSASMLWAAVAGALGGVGVFFETETGIYLLVVFMIYSVLQAGLARGQGRPADWKQFFLPPVVFGGAAAVTMLPLLLYASHGTLFTAAFGKGWVEALVLFGSSGVGALPIAELPDTPLTGFMIMIAVYLGVVAYVLLRGLHGTASRGEVLLATLAAYGLAILLLFVGRSHPFNLCHAAPPFAVLLTALLYRGHSALPGLLQSSALPYALVVGLVLLLLTKSQFRSYPSLLGSVLQSRPPDGVSLRTSPLDISGLPPAYEHFALEVQNICSTIRTLAPDGKGVAILDLNDTMLYSLANVRPWSRYASLYHMALTPSALEGIRDDLIARSPKYVVIRGQNAVRPPTWDFVWASLYEAVTNHYVLRQTVESYEIWGLPHSAQARSPLAETSSAQSWQSRVESEVLRHEKTTPARH
jgi:hypothetical protein